MPFRTVPVTLTLCLALVAMALEGPAFAAPSPGPSATASPASAPGPEQSPAIADPAMTARAKEWLHRAQAGTIDHTQLDDKMNTLLTDALTKQVAAQIAPLGEPLTFEFVEIRTLGPSTLHVYKCTFKTATFYWLFSTDTAGKISGMQLVPPAAKE